MRAKTAIILLALMAPPVSAQISPGELAAPHEFLEGMKNCLKCHDLGEGPSASKCLDCHGEIAERIDANAGFHHRVVNEQGALCFECHSDHAGRGFELIRWPEGRDNFDHAATGWPLSGAHAETQCRDCHRAAHVGDAFRRAHGSVPPERTFLGLDSACTGCHPDPHAGQFARDCTECHGDAAWKPAARFDHAVTQFPLIGAHARVDCARCHTVDASPGNDVVRYTGLSAGTCANCHADPHKGRMGTDCTSCHGQETWNQLAGFDHSRTAFPLTGRHRDAPCEKCHAAQTDDGSRWAVSTTFSSCAPCHDDPHSGRLGPECATCHTTGGWSNVAVATTGSFDHARTVFPLRGRHASVTCEKCHTTGSKTDPLQFSMCSDCHNDPHEGQFAGRAERSLCDDCHNENGFVPALFTAADHGTTTFALSGAHLALPCTECHTMQTFPSGRESRRFVFGDAGCESCHADIHRGQFSDSAPVKECVACHDTNTWAHTDFDHDAKTSYRLEGQHRSAPCSGCHTRAGDGDTTFTRYRETPTSCEACHGETPAQLGGQT